MITFDESPFEAASADRTASAPAAACVTRMFARREAVALGAVSALGAAVSALPVRSAEASDILGVVETLGELVEQLVTEANEIVDAFGAYDFPRLKEHVDAAAVITASMKDEVSGWVWGVAEFVPVYGGDIRKARTLIGMLAEIMNVALVPAADALATTSFEQLVVRTSSGVSIDGDILTELIRIAEETVPVLQSDVEEIQGFSDFAVEELQEAFVEARDVLDDVSRWLSLAGRALPAIRSLAGCDGATRNFLIVVQDNGRVLSTGGRPGAVGTLTAENGDLVLQGFSAPDVYLPAGSATGSASGSAAAGELSEDELALFGSVVAEDPCAAGRIPHFPSAAAVWRDAASAAAGVEFDTVVAVDPGFVGRVLEMCGSSWSPEGLAGYAAAGEGGAEDEAGFVEAAESSFDAVLDDIVSCDFAELVSVVSRGVRERRLNVWSSDDDEEALFEDLGCAGSLSGERAGAKVGVFLSGDAYGADAPAAARWLERSFAFTGSRQGGSGETIVSATLTVRNATPSEIAALAEGSAGSVDGSSDEVSLTPSLTLFAYAPAGGSFSSFTAGASTVSGASMTVEEASHMGRDLFVCEFSLLPGESVEFSCDIVAPVTGSGSGTVSVGFDTSGEQVYLVEGDGSETVTIGLDATPLCAMP